MPNTYFQFKQFRIDQKRSGMKVTTDACLFGAWVANFIKDSSLKPHHVLDIGTGTGLLALMIAQATENSQIDGVEMNKYAHQEAIDNFSNSPWDERLTSSHSYIQKFHSSSKYDMIICNPPFFGKNLKGQLSNKNQAMHNDYLSMEELSDCIDKHLSNEGISWILFPEFEMKVFTKWMEKKGLYQTHEVSIRNKDNTPIFRIIGGFSRDKKSPETNEILIRKEDGSYSDEFYNLLQDYYLWEKETR